jgi:ribonuclease Z
MQVILLGTGSPKSTPDRSKPANVVIAGSKAFLVDCGGGVVERLLAAGVLPESVKDVLFTHHHSDHNSGFVDFFVSGWTGAGRFSRSEPLNVYGPSNTGTIIGKLMEHLAWDIQLRVLQAKNDPRGGEVNYMENDDGVVYDDDGVKITAFPVDHGIVKPAIGYKFEYRGKTIIISGDTRPCENMVHHAKGTDILVHEAYSKHLTDFALERMPGKNEAKTRSAIESVMQYHSSTVEAAEIAKEAEVKHLVFTHLLPPPSPVWYFEKIWTKGVSDIYGGKVTVGRDLMAF